MDMPGFVAKDNQIIVLKNILKNAFPSVTNMLRIPCWGLITVVLFRVY